jgi:hypothetical protein
MMKIILIRCFFIQIPSRVTKSDHGPYSTLFRPAIA